MSPLEIVKGGKYCRVKRGLPKAQGGPSATFTVLREVLTLWSDGRVRYREHGVRGARDGVCKLKTFSQWAEWRQS